MTKEELLNKRYDDLEEKLSSVRDTIEEMICERLDQFGIYYRIFSRVKSGKSIRKKLSFERYQENKEKKIQDLFGVRIMLYYQDDIEICKRILVNMFSQTGNKEQNMLEMEEFWEQYETTEETFTAKKINGVFALPCFIRQLIDPVIMDLRIEDTFEIQLRTVFFEGWHEIEHDLRYKNQELWNDMPKESRKLNSVLATLEMCDQYLLTLFYDIGHGFYKKGSWEQMIQYKFRLKTLNQGLDPVMEELLTKGLARQIFKWKKKNVFDYALEKKIDRLDANVIVYLANEKQRGSELFVPAIEKRFAELEKEKRRGFMNKPFEQNVAILQREKAFKGIVTLSQNGESKEDVFEHAAEIIFSSWMKKTLSHLFPDIFAQEIHSFSIAQKGVRASLVYQKEKLYLKADLSHIAMDEPGKVWEVTLEIKEQEGRMLLTCNNVFLRPPHAAQVIQPYSRPRIYAELGRKIGFSDQEELVDDIKILKPEELEALEHLILNPNRKYPVIVFSVMDEKECVTKGSCYRRMVGYNREDQNFGQTRFMYKTAFVSHVYTVTGETAKEFAKWMKEVPSEISVRFFGKNCENNIYRRFGYEEIINYPKDVYVANTKPPYHYRSVSGPDAVRHEVIQMIYRDVLKECE